MENRNDIQYKHKTLRFYMGRQNHFENLKLSITYNGLTILIQLRCSLPRLCFEYFRKTITIE